LNVVAGLIFEPLPAVRIAPQRHLFAATQSA
jgi:hypothetical protein